MKMRVHIDYNQLIEKLDGLLAVSKSKYAKEWGFTIGIGFNMLSSYLKDIGQRAIELQDEKLLELLKGCGIVKESKNESESRNNK